MSIFTRHNAVSVLFVLGFGACDEAPTEPAPDEQSNENQPVNTAPIIHESTTPDAGAPNPGVIDGGQTTMPDAAAEDPDTGTHSTGDAFAAAYAVISTNCVSCHGAGKTLDMSTPELAHDQLVGVEAKYKACAADGGLPKVRVVPGAPESSLLIEKIEGHPSCGKQMPMTMLLNPEDIAIVRAWVSAGAPSH